MSPIVHKRLASFRQFYLFRTFYRKASGTVQFLWGRWELGECYFTCRHITPPSKRFFWEINLPSKIRYTSYFPTFLGHNIARPPLSLIFLGQPPPLKTLSLACPPPHPPHKNMNDPSAKQREVQWILPRKQWQGQFSPQNLFCSFHRGCLVIVESGGSF